jgi:HEAT repeat protein
VTRAERRIAEHIANFGSADKKVAKHAEWYMIRHYNGQATAALIAACASPNPVVRFRAAWCLGKSRDPAAFETLLAMTDDSDECVRYDSVLSLGHLGDERAIEPLFRMALAQDATRPADNALSEFGLAAMSAVEELYRTGPPATRCSATDDAGHMATKEGCYDRCIALLRTACDDLDPYVRENAEYWLSELGVVAGA